MLGESCAFVAALTLKLTLISLLAGWVLTCVASGMESAAHIAEDTKSPARTVPLAMFWSVAATYIMGWIVSSFHSDLSLPLRC